MRENTGMLHIVGVGPGHPDLITLKAARLIQTASHIVYFAKKGKKGHARTIADSLIADTAQEIRLEYPFTTEISFHDPAYREGIDAFYDRCAETMQDHLRRGTSLVLLSEGDPFLYGSCLYVFDRLKPFFPIEITPGIPAMAGSWSAACTPISHGDDVLSIIPATLPLDHIVVKLSACEAAIIMKVGQNLNKVRAALTQTGLLSRALYIQNATQPLQTIQPLHEYTNDHAPYFSLIMIPGRQKTR